MKDFTLWSDFKVQHFLNDCKGQSTAVETVTLSLTQITDFACWWCLPCFGFLFFDPLGLAQQEQDRRSAAGESEGLSRNSRQSNIIISVFTVHKTTSMTEDAGVWGCYHADIQMLNRDGNHSLLEIWNIVVNNDAFQTSTLLQRLTHRGRRQWLMLWSWWVVCWYSRAARCPCITSQPYVERGDEAAFHGYPLQTHFLLPAYTLRVTLGTLVNNFECWCVSAGDEAE